MIGSDSLMCSLKYPFGIEIFPSSCFRNINHAQPKTTTTTTTATATATATTITCRQYRKQ
eukprot:2289943-Amphidinium_carterae.1